MMTKKGFTLVELLVTLGVASLFFGMATSIFIDAVRGHRAISQSNSLTEDAYIAMEALVSSIEQNAIDYEEYYNQMHKQKIDFGATYGEYGKQFYDCGTPNQAGFQCKNDVEPSNPTCIPVQATLDKNIGKFPKQNPNSDCALCNGGSEKKEQENLYLISPDGTLKTIYALETIDINKEATLSVLKMSARDVDQNGVPDRFTPADGFSCVKEARYDLTNTEQAPDEDLCFLPVISKRTVVKDVKELKFFISPPEDPYKAFAEDLTTLVQPSVKIVLTVAPKGGDENAKTVTLERTVVSRVQTEVPSFPALTGMSCL